MKSLEDALIAGNKAEHTNVQNVVSQDRRRKNYGRGNSTYTYDARWRIS